MLLILYIVYNKAKGIPYKLIFLRRVWNGVYPGQDPIADAVFLYPQVSIYSVKSSAVQSSEQPSSIFEIDGSILASDLIHRVRKVSVHALP